jgi:serine/threonine protein kinase
MDRVIDSPLVTSRSALGRMERLGQGGTAWVYRVPEFSLPREGRLVYKEYRAAVRAKANPALLPGLLSLTEFRARLPADRRDKLDQRTIWPLVVVTGDDGAALGIVMREIPAEFFQGKKPRELQLLFHADDDARQQGLPQFGLHERLVICARIAATYMLLHRLDIIIGDVSPRNIVFTLGASPKLLAVDTDSARVKGTRGALGAQPHTPAWEPPEALTAKRLLDHGRRAGQSAVELRGHADTWQRQTKQTDVYKFGLMVLRVIDYGRRCSRRRDPERARRLLRERAGPGPADLLIRSLDSNPGARPTMEDWYRAFRGPDGSGGPATGGPPDSMRPASRGSAAGPVVRTAGDWRFVEGTGWIRD